MNSDIYDFIIVGSGPAGLTASIIAARNGFNCIILEKGPIAGPKPRGEGIEHFPLIDELVGKDFLPLISTYSEPSKDYHSPGDKYCFSVERKGYKHYFFPWRKFIDKLSQVANDQGVEIFLNSIVIEPIVKNDICIGVRYKDDHNEVREIFGNVVLGCDGYESIMGRSFGISYDQINCPMIKCNIKNANIDVDETPGLQFYLIGNGDLSYAPSFPPCVAYVFPTGGNNAEIGLMLRMMKAFNMKTMSMPSKTEILMVWEHLKNDYPGFSSFLKNSSVEYEEVTAIPNARLVSSVIPKPGVVLVGDSAGFIDPSDSSGLYSSMYMAKFWVEMIGRRIKDIQKDTNENSDDLLDIWGKDNINHYLKQWEKDPFYKHIRKRYLLVGLLEWYSFKHLRTSKKMNKRWRIISTVMKKGL